MEEDKNQNIVQILKSILDIEPNITGTAYLQEFIKNIALTLGIKYVFIGHVTNQDLTSVQTDVVWANGEFVDNFEYDLIHTPCAHVLSGKRVCIHDKNVSIEFPEDVLLQQMGVESYIGAPVISNISYLSSILVLLDDKPIQNIEFFTSLIEFLALRASAENKIITYDKEIHRKKRQIEKQEQKFHDIIRNINDFVWEVDESGVFTYASPQVKNILGYSVEEVLGKTPFDFIIDNEKDSIVETFQKISTLKQPIDQMKNTNIHKDGSIVYLETSGVPILDKEGNLKGYRGTDRDITKRVLSEILLEENHQKIQELNKQLESRVDEEKEKNEKKQKLLLQQSKMATMGEMIGNIAHQLKQPLSIISTSASSVHLKSDLGMLEKEELNTSMDNISFAVQHLSHTIDDFRNFFKTDREKIDYTLNDVFEKTFKLVSAQFKNANITIEKDIQDTVINGFENDLIQVLLNILNNARDELIKQKKDLKLIKIDTILKDKILEISILDNAGGIAENIQDKIFDSYFTTKKDTHGTGIGLYMTKMIIEEHMEGNIETENVSYLYQEKEHYGANFIIKIPLLS